MFHVNSALNFRSGSPTSNCLAKPSVLIDHGPNHLTSEVMEMHTIAMIWVITFVPHIKNIYQLFDLMWFRTCKRVGKSRLTFTDHTSRSRFIDNRLPTFGLHEWRTVLNLRECKYSLNKLSKRAAMSADNIENAGQESTMRFIEESSAS
jgi:hypothetical protein